PLSHHLRQRFAGRVHDVRTGGLAHDEKSSRRLRFSPVTTDYGHEHHERTKHMKTIGCASLGWFSVPRGTGKLQVTNNRNQSSMKTILDAFSPIISRSLLVP